ncbi:hypothetical protein PHYC_03468 [Phycisphaerales bacterium]|nr:hypothetical protein PHYC_03468 [Phycisphaerales bacterium]
MTTEPFTSTLPFDHTRTRAAAIYCSDGRYNEQFDEFLHTRLNLPCYDRLVVPGGPAALAGHMVTHRAEDELDDELRFLIQHHALTRVVLLAHAGCGFYLKKLLTAPAALHDSQVADLHRAAARIRAMAANLLVEAYFAQVHDGLVTITPIPV